MGFYFPDRWFLWRITGGFISRARIGRASDKLTEMLAILISFSNLFILVPVVARHPPTFQTDLSPQGAGPALVWHAAFRGRLVKEIKVKGKGGIMSKSLRVSLGAKDSRTPHVSKKSHPSPSLPLSHVFHCLDLTPASGCTICIPTLIQTLDYKNKTWAHFDNCIWGAFTNDCGLCASLTCAEARSVFVFEYIKCSLLSVHIW